MSAAADALMGIFGFNRVEGGDVKTDRELLELAARAIGLTLRYNYLGGRDARQPWNPLEDDGDALRLAVKLNLRVFPQERCCYVESCPESLLGMSGVTEMEMNCSDPLPATRRAIVRAAAAIGEQMK